MGVRRYQYLHCKDYDTILASDGPKEADGLALGLKILASMGGVLA